MCMTTGRHSELVFWSAVCGCHPPDSTHVIDISYFKYPGLVRLRKRSTHIGPYMQYLSISLWTEGALTGLLLTVGHLSSVKHLRLAGSFSIILPARFKLASITQLDGLTIYAQRSDRIVDDLNIFLGAFKELEGLGIDLTGDNMVHPSTTSLHVLGNTLSRLRLNVLSLTGLDMAWIFGQAIAERSVPGLQTLSINIHEAMDLFAMIRILKLSTRTLRPLTISDAQSLPGSRLVELSRYGGANSEAWHFWHASTHWALRAVA
ncbi:hypothetical protein OBBRIDRAFT_153615 [Obba rivulosa]|uniref:Uncharacterized protein n=1 Tax=Obba rivulosa TaxID=1052685 RepID=A0A8E2DM29_9APHY|nr:hypothetical protein OBBRIDRAFT_153615 [Obba rivulosa]